MIKINKLYSLEDILDYYYIDDDLNIINAKKGHIKAQCIGKRGYLQVSLRDKNGKQRSVSVHKIIALAFIRNAEYEVINHKDGNKLNNAVDNLEFCTQRYNTIHAYENGLINHTPPKIFRITFLVKPFFETYLIGTMKDLANKTNIPLTTLYWLFYSKSYSVRYNIISIDEFEIY